MDAVQLQVQEYNTLLCEINRRSNSGNLYQNDIEDLIGCLRYIVTCDISQDFQLLCLSTMGQVAEKISEKKVMNIDLTNHGRVITGTAMTVLKTSTNRFVTYAAQKSLVTVVNVLTCKTMVNDILVEMAEILKEKNHRITVITAAIETFTGLLSCQHKEDVIEMIMITYPFISKHLMAVPSSDDEKLMYVACLSLTTRCVTDLFDLNCHEKLEKIMQCMEQLLSTKDQTFTKDSILLRKLLNLFHSIFPYSYLLSKNISPSHGQAKLGDSILHWISFNGLVELPRDSQQGFGGDVILACGESRSRSEFCSNSSLRSLVLLVFRVVAVLLQHEPDADVSVAWQCLKQLDQVVTKKLDCKEEDHLIKSYKGFDWIIDMFGDQDDALFETMLALLNIHLHMKKRTVETTEPHLLEIDPHRQFYQFLKMTGFDHSILIDLLMSPETCFLMFLTRYLKYILVSWKDFISTYRFLGQERHTHACKGSVGDCNQEFTSNDAEGTMMQPGSDQEGILCDGLHLECESELTCQSFITQSASFKEQLVTKETESTVMETNSYIMSDTSSSVVNTNEKEEKLCFLEGSCVQVMQTSTGLGLLSLYGDDSDSDAGDDDDDDEEEEEIEEDENTISNRKHLFEEEPTHETSNVHCDKSNSNELPVGRCGDRNDCLDDAMATLIRLRLKTESLHINGLFPYNPGPLVHLIEKCEDLYEGN